METTRDQYIVALRKYDCMTLEQIGQEFGITRERVRQILKTHGMTGVLPRKSFELTEEQKRANRFLKKTVFYPPTGCWIWIASLSRDGYGRTVYKGVPEFAHRVSCLLFKSGTVPRRKWEGMDIAHLCCVTNCVNPDHLVLQTHSENMKYRYGESCTIHTHDLLAFDMASSMC